MNELESQLSNLERDLSDVNTNYVALKKNHLELLELKNVLQKSETFLSETNLQIADGSGNNEESRSEYSMILYLMAKISNALELNMHGRNQLGMLGWESGRHHHYTLMRNEFIFAIAI